VSPSAVTAAERFLGELWPHKEIRLRANRGVSWRSHLIWSGRAVSVSG
jgi:hypothetical protein